MNLLTFFCLKNSQNYEKTKHVGENADIMCYWGIHNFCKYMLMKRNLRRSVVLFGVRQKVLLILLFVLITALSVSGWLALQSQQENTLGEIQQRGTDISRFVAKSVVYSVVGYDYHTLDLLLDEVVKSEDVGYSAVFNREGRKMAEAGVLLDDDPSKMFIFREKLLLNEDEIGLLILGFNTARTMLKLEQHKYDLIKREALIIILIVIGEFIALSIIIIRPVSIISAALEKKRPGDVSIGRIPLHSSDEFGELARKYNELSDDLEQANYELQSKVDFADAELIKANNLLLERTHELVELNEKFKEQSITDSLTGLFNRRHFEETLEEEIEISKRHGDINSLMIIDIDKFKQVNDAFGHFNGDKVIQWVAEILKDRFRETDVVCRIGGEEFGVICRRADKQAAIQLAEAIRDEIESTRINVETKDISLTVSIGISTLSAKNQDMNADQAFKFADMALYYSKEHGRNCVTHYSNILN